MNKKKSNLIAAYLCFFIYGLIIGSILTHMLLSYLGTDLSKPDPRFQYNTESKK